MMVERILVTGVGGFIGFHTTLRLLSLGYEVIGVDNMNTYYDVKLKEDRLSILNTNPSFTFHMFGIEDRSILSNVFEKGSFKRVIHLAGQAGVRAPASHANRYITSNLVGFSNLLDLCREHKIQHRKECHS